MFFNANCAIQSIVLDITKQFLFDLMEFHWACFQVLIEGIGLRWTITLEFRIRLRESKYLMQEGLDKLLLRYGRMGKLQRIISQILMNPNLNYPFSINIDHVLFGYEATKLSHDFLVG